MQKYENRKGHLTTTMTDLTGINSHLSKETVLTKHASAHYIQHGHITFQNNTC
jgi:hypothetical protein